MPSTKVRKTGLQFFNQFQSEFRDVAKPPCAWYRAKGAEFGSVSSQTCSEIGLQLWRHKLMQHGLGTSASKGASTGQEHQQQQLRSLSCLVMARAVLVASMADVSPILGGSGAVPKSHVIPFCWLLLYAIFRGSRGLDWNLKIGYSPRVGIVRGKWWPSKLWASYFSNKPMELQ